MLLFVTGKMKEQLRGMSQAAVRHLSQCSFHLSKSSFSHEAIKLKGVRSNL